MSEEAEARTVYITDGLLEVLLDRAAAAEPGAVTLTLGSTPATKLTGDIDISGETPVLTDLFLPGAGEAVSEVFGMDLGRPPKTTAARFISHPTGELTLTREDHLAARVLIAVPPWSESDVGAFTRRGTRLPLVSLKATPPERTLE